VGENTGYILRRKQAVASSISNWRHNHFAAGNPGDGSSKPRGSASRQRKSVWRGAEDVQEDAGAKGC
jgi:hypothetical protein